MKIYMIRHAKTQANSEGRYVGIIDVPISEQGRDKAESLAPIPHTGKVYISPMRRTVETADILFPKSEKKINDKLKEMDFGRFEGKNHDELKDNKEYIDWIDRGGLEACPGGEAPESFGRRVFDGVREIIIEACNNGDEEVFIVTHGGVIMSVMYQVTGEEGALFDYMSPNCGGWAFEIEDFGRDKDINVIGYFPFENTEHLL